jgi:hypothetical protein
MKREEIKAEAQDGATSFKLKNEDKIIYQNGAAIRVVRGRLRPQDSEPDFFVLDRDDGIVKVAKKVTISIVEGVD